MSVVPRAGLPGTNYERTFIAIKPDGVQRNLVGEIVSRFEKKGYKLVAMKMLTPSKEKAEGHYADLSSKPFFGGLVKYFSSGPIVAMVWEGFNAIAGGRTLLGATNPKDSLPGTIRGDLCIDIGRNICHGSDGVESAKHEVEFWFSEEEVQSYTNASHSWVYEKGAPVRPNKSSNNKSGAGKKDTKKSKAPKKDDKHAKKVKACIKEGGKKGQDICGMSVSGVHFFLTIMEEPEGNMDLLKLCMEGANKKVDPDADDRKGGAGDLGKIFFSSNDENLAIICHVPEECKHQLDKNEFLNACIVDMPNPTITQIDEHYVYCELKANPDKGVYTLKQKDQAIAHGFEFLTEKGLLPDEDSGDEINFADDCGIDLNGGGDNDDY